MKRSGVRSPALCLFLPKSEVQSATPLLRTCSNNGSIKQQLLSPEIFFSSPSEFKAKNFVKLPSGTMQATSFGALIMLGNQRKWLEKFQEYLNFDHAAVVSNPSFNRLKLKIYHREGIDYIFPEVNFYSIDEIYDAADKIKLFIAERHYLEAKMLFFLNYMSPKYHQVLRCLAIANIEIGLVSLVPGELSRDIYLDACSYLNIKHKFFADRTIDLNDAEKHIQGFVEDMFSPELSALASLSLSVEKMSL